MEEASQPRPHPTEFEIATFVVTSLIGVAQLIVALQQQHA
jgi:hypothetical protein